MNIRGENIELTAIEPDDYKQMTATLKDPQVMRNLFWYPYKLKDMAFDEWLKGARQNRQTYYFAVKERRDAAVAGICAYQDIDYRNGSIALWVVIAPEFVSKGYGEQALKLLARNAFDQLRMEHISLYCLERDGASKTCAKAAGFSLDMIQKSRIKREDKRLDIELYSLLKEKG